LHSGGPTFCPTYRWVFWVMLGIQVPIHNRIRIYVCPAVAVDWKCEIARQLWLHSLFFPQKIGSEGALQLANCIRCSKGVGCSLWFVYVLISRWVWPQRLAPLTYGKSDIIWNRSIGSVVKGLRNYVIYSDTKG